MSRSIRAKILDGSFKPMMGKRIEYDGNFYRLSYEVTRAKYLTEQNIPWRYEEITYDLGDTTYTPDFFIYNKEGKLCRIEDVKSAQKD